MHIMGDEGYVVNIGSSKKVVALCSTPNWAAGHSISDESASMKWVLCKTPVSSTLQKPCPCAWKTTGIFHAYTLCLVHAQIVVLCDEVELSQQYDNAVSCCMTDNSL